MPEKQQTFGKVEVTELEHETERNPYCTKDQNGERCENRAILKVNNSLSTRAEYRCGIHAKMWMLDEIEYDKP